MISKEEYMISNEEYEFAKRKLKHLYEDNRYSDTMRIDLDAALIFAMDAIEKVIQIQSLLKNHNEPTEETPKMVLEDMKTIKGIIGMDGKIFTGYYDHNNKPIFVGDTIKEGCNGLVSTVEWNGKRSSFWLKGLGEGYGIENSHIEWDKINKDE